MKIIDKTPYVDAKGSIGMVQRVQATLEFGPSWSAEVEAQKGVITQLERVLEKGFTLIRNLNLENSKIIEPLILVGPPGVYIIYVTPLTGFFEAKGDQWNIVKGTRRSPAPVNLLTRVGRLARAVQVFLNRQGVILPSVVEPILIAADPGVHVESSHPTVRIVLSDGVKQFAASLLQGRPMLRPESVAEVVDHLINPHRKASAAQSPASPFEARSAPAPMYQPGGGDDGFIAAAEPEPPQAPQRARAIFQAAEETKPFDPADLDFEFDENISAEVPVMPADGSAPAPAQPRATVRGLSGRQLIFLVALGLIELLILAGFLYTILFSG